MEVICLESEAFYSLVEKVIDHIKEKNNITHDKWIDGETAMQILGIKSKTTLQSMRDNGLIRYTQPKKKIILYDRDSIMDYLDRNAQFTF
jgi:hypothetical protein